MENAVVEQLYALFIFALSGMIIGVFFDLFRILRRTFKTPDFITYIEDIFFWIGTGIFLLCVLFRFTNGEIRNYTIIGLVAGIVIYMLWISKYFIKVNVTILTFIKTVCYKVFYTITFPFRYLARWIGKGLSKLFCSLLKRPFSFLVINIRKNITKIGKNKKKISKKRRILMYNVEKYK